MTTFYDTRRAVVGGRSGHSRLRKKHRVALTTWTLLLAAAPAHATWHFTDVTAQAGVAYQHGWIDPLWGLNGTARPASVVAAGVAAGDYDQDGFVDLYVVRGDIGPNLLFHNLGNGTFAEVGAAAGVALPGTRGSGPVFADFDGDGWPDLLVLGVGAAVGQLTRPTLFRNRSDGTFEDVTAHAGITSDRDAMSAAFGDYDRDGDLDVFVTHWNDNFPPGPTQQLWRNDGDGTFTDVSAASGIAESYTHPDGVIADQSFTADFADIDNDGWPDLLITGDYGTSQVFHNNRNGTFTNTTDRAVITDQNGMGAAVGDYDGDGNVDWFVTSIWDPDQNDGGNNWGVTGNRLYRGHGDGTFEDVTEAAGVRAGYWGWGATFADLDDDGNLDIYETNGWDRHFAGAAEFWFDLARAFIANGNGTFSERSTELGLDDTLEGRGVVAFDYDRDGDLDLFVAPNQGPFRLYRNDGGNAANWLEVKLRGRAPNTEAIGARVFVKANGRTQMRELRAGSNFVSQNPAEAHFGLGTAASVTVTVIWPDGANTTRDPVAANQRLVLDQPVPGVDEQTPQQLACITALNAAGAKVTAAAGRRLVRCVQTATADGGTGATACLAADPTGEIATAEARTTAAAATWCALPPSFGPTSAAAVNAAAVGLLRPGDVFGPNLETAFADKRVDPARASCQLAVARGLVRVANAKVKAFDTCKSSGIRHGTIRSAAALRGCWADVSGARVARVVASTQGRAAHACAGTTVAAALPGGCAGASLAGLAGCVDTQASCGVCLALDAGDALGRVCHQFVAGVASPYCGDRPVTSQSVARQWDEEILEAIRHDTPRPTVHARNLFHFSAVMWDAWRAYGGGGRAYLTDESPTTADAETDRAIAISFAAYRLLSYRYSFSASAASTQAHLDARMLALGYDKDFTSTTGSSPAAVGNRIAAAMIAFGRNVDGANEAGNYGDPTYAPVNAPLVVKLPGTDMVDPNRWQPLALDVIVTQNGIVLPDKVQGAIGLRWNGVVPFALVRTDPTAVYIDPGPPPQLSTQTCELDPFKQAAVRVLQLSSELTPDDGATIDLSPGAYGNNPLGTNDGTGRALNPLTGQPYAPQVVARGDFGRVLAEFWADGPNSETPPGHWNVLANYVSDHPTLGAKRIGGTGPIVSDLEWDVKLYFAMNGAVHDAAIVAWGLKRRYDSVRPISMIRYLGGHGQCSDPAGPSWDPAGLPLVPGLIEVITPESSAPGQRHAALAAYVGEVAVHAWPGQPANPATSHSGVQWIRAKTWVPYQKSTFVTPAFPAYTSGHSTFSRAAAEVLAGFTGSPYFPGGLGEFVAPANHYLTFELGPTTDVHLQWATYYDAADQAGQSRLWGGIHISADDFNGRITGSRIGTTAWALAQQFYAGGP